MLPQPRVETLYTTSLQIQRKTTLSQKRIMINQDLGLFILGIAVLTLYLIFSALTEMGTKLPWKK